MYKFKEFLSEKYFKTDVGTRFLQAGSENYSETKNSAIKGFKKKVDDLHNTLSAHYPKAENDDEKAVNDYTENSLDLNSYLHTKHIGTHRGTYLASNSYYDRSADRLSKHLSEVKAPETFHVYSGLKNSPEIGQNVKEETDHFKAHLPAFTSASIDPEVATRFSHPEGENTKEGKIYHRHVLKIEIPEGSNHGKYIAGHSNHPGEKEFLIDKGKNIHISKTPQIIKEKTYTDPGNPQQYSHTHIWHAKIV